MMRIDDEGWLVGEDGDPKERISPKPAPAPREQLKGAAW
jgi:hypothetical protein